MLPLVSLLAVITGDVSVRLTFVIQAVFQIVLGIMFYLILGSHEKIEEKWNGP